MVMYSESYGFNSVDSPGFNLTFSSFRYIENFDLFVKIAADKILLLINIKTKDDKKKEIFKNFDIIEVAVTNVNEYDYLIDSNIKNLEKVYDFNDYSKLESLCDNGCKTLAVLVSLAAAGVSGTFFMASLAFNDVNIAYNGIVLGVPILAAVLGYKGVKAVCIDGSKEDRYEKINKFFNKSVITFGQTIVNAKSEIKKYCLFFRGAKKYNLTFTNKNYKDEEIIFNFSPDTIIDKENIEIETDPIRDDLRDDKEYADGFLQAVMNAKD